MGGQNYPSGFCNRFAALYRNTGRDACAMADRKGPNAKLTGAIQMAAPALTRKELLDRLRIEFPDAGHAVGDYEIEELWRGGCRLRQRYDHRALRPGGTLSGATMMALAASLFIPAALSATGGVPSPV